MYNLWPRRKLQKQDILMQESKVIEKIKQMQSSKLPASSYFHRQMYSYPEGDSRKSWATINRENCSLPNRRATGTSFLEFLCQQFDYTKLANGKNDANLNLPRSCLESVFSGGKKNKEWPGTHHFIQEIIFPELEHIY